MIGIIDCIDGGGRPAKCTVSIDTERNTDGAGRGPARGSHVLLAMHDENGQYQGTYSFDAGELLHVVRSVSGPK